MSVDATLDVGTFDFGPLPRRKVQRPSGSRTPGFQVVIRRQALDLIEEHTAGRLDVEVCGILAGNLYRDTIGPYLLISAAIPGHAAAQRGASVTLTAETWENAAAVMEKQHPDRKMCGWYHSHPDFGVFLSDADVFIQQNFFNLPWQVALVRDPVRGDTGSFVWQAGKPQRQAFVVEEPRGGHQWVVKHQAQNLPRRKKVQRALLAAFIGFMIVLLLGLLGLYIWQGLSPDL